MRGPPAAVPPGWRRGFFGPFSQCNGSPRETVQNPGAARVTHVLHWSAECHAETHRRQLAGQLGACWPNLRVNEALLRPATPLATAPSLRGAIGNLAVLQSARDRGRDQASTCRQCNEVPR